MGRSRFRWAGSDRLAQHLAVSSFRNGSSWRLDARGYSYDRPHRRVTNVVRRTPLGRAKAWAGVAIRERHALLSQALPELPQKQEPRAAQLPYGLGRLVRTPYAARTTSDRSSRRTSAGALGSSMS